MVGYLDEMRIIKLSVYKQAVNAVIGFNIVKNFISFGKKIAVHLFIRTNIQRIFKNTAQVRSVEIGYSRSGTRCRSCSIDTTFRDMSDNIGQRVLRVLIQVIRPSFVSVLNGSESE